MSRGRKSVTAFPALRRKSDIIMRFNEFAATPDSDSFLELDKALTGSRAAYGSVELDLDEKLAILQSIKSSTSFRFSHGFSFDGFVGLFATMSKDQDAINHIKSQLSLLDLAQDKRANAIILDQAIDEFFFGRDSKLNLSEKCQFLTSNCKDSESLSGAIAEYQQQMMQITAQKEVIIENTLTIFANEMERGTKIKLPDDFRISAGHVTRDDIHTGGTVRPLKNTDRAFVLAQALRLSLEESAKPLSSHDQLEVAQAVLDRYCYNPTIEGVVRRFPPPHDFAEEEVAFSYAKNIASIGIVGITGYQMELQRKIEDIKSSKMTVDHDILRYFLDPGKSDLSNKKITIDGRGLIVSRNKISIIVSERSGNFTISANMDFPGSYNSSLMQIDLPKEGEIIEFNNESLSAKIKSLATQENGTDLIDKVLSATSMAEKAVEALSRPKSSPSLTAASLSSRLSRLFKSGRGVVGSASAR